MRAKKRREIETRLFDAYTGRADTLLEEVEDLLSRQSWPNDRRQRLHRARRTATVARALADDPATVEALDDLLAEIAEQEAALAVGG